MKFINLRELLKIYNLLYTVIDIAFDTIVCKNNIESFLIECIAIKDFLKRFCQNMYVMSSKKPIFKCCVHIWIVRVILCRCLSK